MKRITLSLLLSLITLTFYGQYRGFQWIGPNHTLYKIDVSSSILSKQTSEGDWQTVGKLKTEYNVFNELPIAFDVNTFYTKNTCKITISGTGQVYELDFNNLSLLRLDKTYYRGFNFDATQFVRNDTLFSVGGTGFWQRHSVVTFYNAENKEWDLLKPENKNYLPSSFHFSGYSKQKDAFFTAFTFQDSILANKQIPLLIFNFKTKLWSNKGVLTAQMLSLAKNKFKSVWTGDFLICFYDDVLIVDPFSNKLYRYDKGPDKFFLENAFVYYQNGHLYSRQLNTTVKGNKFILDSLAMTEVIKDSKLIGKAYNSPKTNSLFLVLGITASCVIVLGFIFIKLKRIKRDKELTALELKLLKEFLINKDEFMSSNAVNSILNLNDKSYDNQRQIRNRIINTINIKLYSFFGSKELIKRVSDDGDKRVMNYYLNPDIRSRDLEKLKVN